MTNIDQGHRPAQPPTGRAGRRRRWAAVLAVTAVVAGGGAFAAAEAATGSPTAPAALAAGTQSPATTQVDTSAQAAVLNSALNGRGRLARLRRLSGLYGQFTFETKQGPRTLAFERGTIESVAGDDVVVRAKDGTTWRWTLTSESAVREGGKRGADSKRGADGDLKPGELVFTGGPVTGSTRDVRLIVIRKATAGAGQPRA